MLWMSAPARVVLCRGERHERDMLTVLSDECLQLHEARHRPGELFHPLGRWLVLIIRLTAQTRAKDRHGTRIDRLKEAREGVVMLSLPRPDDVLVRPLSPTNKPGKQGAGVAPAQPLWERAEGDMELPLHVGIRPVVGGVVQPKIDVMELDLSPPVKGQDSARPFGAKRQAVAPPRL